MNILCFSINPVFPDVVSGGASKHLMNLTRFLAAKGHQVRILCPALPNQKEPYTINQHLKIWPVLPFHQPFPAPYAITPADLALIVEEINRHLDWAERFYVHDGELLLPQLQTKIPTILSFRDNYYPESILGSFINLADEIICVSPYSASVIKSTAGRVVAGLTERIHIVLNGIDSQTYRPVPLNENLLGTKLPFDPAAHRLLLHPHRPDPNKGLAEALDVLKFLVVERGMDDLILLTPRWHTAMSGSEEEIFFRSMKRQIEENHLQQHIHFLDWLSQTEMPSFYSLGQLTLCLGKLPEAFGNVAYESLACGTPSLVCRVGVHRSLLADALIHKVDYWDSEAACKIALSILEDRQKVSETIRLKILATFDLQKQMSAYEEIILNAQKKPRLEPIFAPVTANSIFTLAPWCFLSEKGIYHDYLGKFLTAQELPALQGILKTLSHSSRVNGSEFPQVLITDLYKLGVLVPAQPG
jgi:glycosyltransferase involved in cell wall biosynthesis